MHLELFPKISRNRLYFFGIGESQLESELRKEMEEMTNPTIAPYAKEGEVMLRVTQNIPQSSLWSGHHRWGRARRS